MKFFFGFVTALVVVGVAALVVSKSIPWWTPVLAIVCLIIGAMFVMIYDSPRF